jgi:hypothetical protein
MDGQACLRFYIREIMQQDVTKVNLSWLLLSVLKNFGGLSPGPIISISVMKSHYKAAFQKEILASKKVGC